MATRALTPVARRQGHDSVSAKKALGRGRGWRQILQSQDAEEIWHELSLFVQTEFPDRAEGNEQLTQELFLHLLTSDRVSRYIEQNYSDSKITEDLVSILCE